jgi:hypothetical protein
MEEPPLALTFREPLYCDTSLRGLGIPDIVSNAFYEELKN